jgi:hypothetical protein
MKSSLKRWMKKISYSDFDLDMFCFIVHKTTSIIPLQALISPSRENTKGRGQVCFDDSNPFGERSPV